MEMDASAQWLENERACLRAALSGQAQTGTPFQSLGQYRAHLAEQLRTERQAMPSSVRIPRVRGGGRRGNHDARAVATALLAELHGPPPPPPPPQPLPAWRTVSSKKLAEARLLLLLSKGGLPYSPRSPKFRCGKCDDCLAGDCGSCASCLDKPKFGGRGCRKQACSARRCEYVSSMSASPRKRA